MNGSGCNFVQFLFNAQKNSHEYRILGIPVQIIVSVYCKGKSLFVYSCLCTTVSFSSTVVSSTQSFASILIMQY